MTSLQIKYFLKAAECMSFSRAAQELFVSQPSVSNQIKQLEQELGYRLFDRTQRNAISLTAAGMVFRDSFRGIEKQYHLAQTRARELEAVESLTLRVGVGSGWDLSRELEMAQAQTLLRYPHSELAFSCHDFQELRHLVREGALDVALFTKTSLLDFSGLEVQQIANLESRAYVRKGLLRPIGERLQAADFADQTLLVLSEEESPMAMELSVLQFQARHVTVAPVYLPNRDSILQALLMGKGVAVFDQYMWFAKDPRLDWFNLEDDIPICLVWRAENTNPLIRLFCDCMAQLMNP